MDNILTITSNSPEIVEQNFESPRGDDFDLDLVFTDDQGDPQPITTWEILFTAKQSKELGDDASSGVVKKAIDITGGPAGLASLNLPAATTEDLLGPYFYDIQYKDDNGAIKTKARGIIVFTKDVTIRQTDVVPTP